MSLSKWWMMDGGVWWDFDFDGGLWSSLWSNLDRLWSSAVDKNWLSHPLLLLLLSRVQTWIFSGQCFSQRLWSVEISWTRGFKATRSAECWNTSESSNPGKAGLHLVASGRSVRCWWFLISKLSKGVVPCGIRACKRLRVTPRIINFQGVMLSKRGGSIALFNTKHETHWWTAEELNVSQKLQYSIAFVKLCCI